MMYEYHQLINIDSGVRARWGQKRREVGPKGKQYGWTEYINVVIIRSRVQKVRI